jgi:hypothetical protein
MSTRYPHPLPTGPLPNAWDPPTGFFRHATCSGSIQFRLDEDSLVYTHARCDTCDAAWHHDGARWKEKER